jgi:hypothetical protein
VLAEGGSREPVKDLWGRGGLRLFHKLGLAYSWGKTERREDARVEGGFWELGEPGGEASLHSFQPPTLL